MNNIPLYKPYISINEKNALLRILKLGKLSRGKEVEKFEKKFADYVKQKYAIAVNSGTSGLHLAVRALGWKNGDEVITTPFSYIASSNALLFEGVKPVFVDIDPLTLNIDVNKIEEKITKKTKGILLVHILGLPVDLDGILKLKKKYNLQIIEDACEAIGRPNKDFTVTRLGDISVYGFHENKQMTSGGEGGMMVTNNSILVKKCWSMRDQGRSTKKNWIKNVILGFNFRMTEMNAVFGHEQLKIIDKILARREKIAQKYSLLLKDISGIVTPHQMISNKRSWFIYFILLKNKKTRNKVHGVLVENGIISSTNYFPPIYNFSMYSGCNKGCPITDNISERLLALPMFYEMTDEEIQQVSNIIKNTLKNK